MSDHNCTENVWWLEANIGKEGETHGKVLIRGSCSICDEDVYAVSDADVFDNKTQDELSEREIQLRDHLSS
jgi:hypothetical protein